MIGMRACTIIETSLKSLAINIQLHSEGPISISAKAPWAFRCTGVATEETADGRRRKPIGHTTSVTELHGSEIHASLSSANITPNDPNARIIFL